MPPFEHSGKHNQMRQRLAQLAARLMAEDGILDYDTAKRKAARQSGAPDTHNLPTNSEVERELRVYQALFQGDEQAERLHTLRTQALQAMHLLQDFSPSLTGAVLDGTAARHSSIDLHVFANSLKDVELFLLNRKIPYAATERRFRFGDEGRMIPVLILEGNPSEIELAVFSVDDLRQAPRSPVGGKAMERAKAQQVQALLETA
ncbi:MAG: hypothetical protein WC091_16030 [Sulfuricellaceae bacterium]